MGIFGKRKKQTTNDDMTDQMKAAYARVEAMNNGTIDINEEYQKTMKSLEEQERKNQEEDYFNQRFQQFNISRGSNYSNQVIKEEAESLLKEFKDKGFSEKPPVTTTSRINPITSKEPNNTVPNRVVSEKVQRPEIVVETELTKLREMGIPEAIIQEFRTKDLEYIKEHRGIASEEVMALRIKEVYQRFNDPEFVNIYRLSPEEFLATGLVSLQQQGLSEEKAEEIKQKLLNSINLHKQHNLPDWSINKDILFKLSSLKNSLLKTAPAQEMVEQQDNSMRI